MGVHESHDVEPVLYNKHMKRFCNFNKETDVETLYSFQAFFIHYSLLIMAAILSYHINSTA